MDKELHSFKRFKKLLEDNIEHNSSYQIGVIIGTVLVIGLLTHKSTVKNEINIRVSALFSKYPPII